MKELNENMRAMKKFLCLILFAALCQWANAQDWPHFITDDAYRAKVFKAFDEKKQLVGEQYVRPIDLLSNSYEVEALRFLYAYMPLADITDYPFDFHLQNVRMSFKTRSEMPWGEKIPELLFRHFVLPERVNNEALDNAREVFYDELKDRVKGLTMQEVPRTRDLHAL